MGNLQRSVANLAALLVEDGSEQTLFRTEFRLALGSDLTHEDVAGANLGTNTNDASLVQVRKHFRSHIGEIAGDLFLAKLGVAGVNFILFDMNRREGVVLDQVLGKDNRVFEVVALP